MKIQQVFARCSLAVLAAAVFIGLATFAGTPLFDSGAMAQQTPTLSQSSGSVRAPTVPPANNLSNTLGSTSDSDFWRQIRRGVQGEVTIPDATAGVMVQSDGESWRSIRNGPLSRYGWWALAGICIVVAVFFAIRGRVRIDSGASGRTIERFNGFERFVHWLTAGSFIVLAITGLNMLYGRYLFAMDAGGGAGQFSALHQTFATLTYYGKIAHNFIGFAFSLGVVLMFVIWVRHNLPDKYDLAWLAKGGGMLVPGVHPPAGKFNFGQKAIFWAVVLSGIALFVTGISLIFPFAWFGMQDMQLAQLIHAGVAIAITAVIIGHIYIGSLGMEGAFDAMGTGQVDENWAREHHSVWMAEAKEGKALSGDDDQARLPAE